MTSSGADGEGLAENKPPVLLAWSTAMGKAAHEYSDKPVQWFLSMVSGGKHVELLALPASDKALLGYGVERLMRGLAVVEDSRAPDGQKKPIFSQEAWDTKALVREAAVAMADLDAFAKEVPNADIPGLKEAASMLLEKGKTSAMRLAVALREGKASLIDVYTESVATIAIVRDLDATAPYPDSVVAVIAKHNQQNSLLQQFTAGVGHPCRL